MAPASPTAAPHENGARASASQRGPAHLSSTVAVRGPFASRIRTDRVSWLAAYSSPAQRWAADRAAASFSGFWSHWVSSSYKGSVPPNMAAARSRKYVSPVCQ